MSLGRRAGAYSAYFYGTRTNWPYPALSRYAYEPYASDAYAGKFGNHAFFDGIYANSEYTGALPQASAYPPFLGGGYGSFQPGTWPSWRRGYYGTQNRYGRPYYTTQRYRQNYGFFPWGSGNYYPYNWRPYYW